MSHAGSSSFSRLTSRRPSPNPENSEQLHGRKKRKVWWSVEGAPQGQGAEICKTYSGSHAIRQNVSSTHDGLLPIGYDQPDGSLQAHQEGFRCVLTASRCVAFHATSASCLREPSKKRRDRRITQCGNRWRFHDTTDTDLLVLQAPGTMSDLSFTVKDFFGPIFFSPVQILKGLPARKAFGAR